MTFTRLSAILPQQAVLLCATFIWFPLPTDVWIVANRYRDEKFFLFHLPEHQPVFERSWNSTQSEQVVPSLARELLEMHPLLRRPYEDPRKTVRNPRLERREFLAKTLQGVRVIIPRFQKAGQLSGLSGVHCGRAVPHDSSGCMVWL